MRSAALGHESAAADNQRISKRFACACQCPLDGGDADDDDTFRLKIYIYITIAYSTRTYSFRDVALDELYYYIYKYL